jgi:Uma2 family endonuclease
MIMALETAAPRAAALPDDRFTVDDFTVLVPDGQKADLIDGGIYVASPDTPRNNELGSFIQVLLDGYASARELGKVFASRVAFELSRHDAPEPDVAFVAAEHLERVGESRVMGGPDLAVEVVSRDSRRRDYVEKKRLYERAGVREYWIVDPLRQRAEYHRLEGDRYVQVPLARDRIFRSEALAGFWLDVDWLFLRPLPNKFRCLGEILAGDPAE